MKRLLALLLLAFVALAFSGCRDSNALARLQGKRNAVERDDREHVGDWKMAEIGNSFFVGDGVRTRDDSTADLHLGDGSSLSLEQNTVLRFLEQPPGSVAPRIDLEIGGAVLSAADEALDLEGWFGNARLQKRGRLRITRSSAGTRFEVTIGSAELATKEGTVVLQEGRSIDLDAKGGLAAAASSASPEPEAVPAAARASAEDGEFTADVRGTGVRIRRSDGNQWRDVPPGEIVLPPDTVLRLPLGTTVNVQRGAERASLRGPGEFTVGAKDRPLVEAKSGSASLEAGKQPLTLNVAGGKIVVNPESRVDLVYEKGTTEVSVENGTATLLGTRNRADLRGGEQAALEPNGDVRLLRRYGPAAADVVVSGDSSFIVHDPEPPTVVGFPVKGSCPAGAIVELDRGRGALPATLGMDRVNVPIPSGVHRYSVRCRAGDQNAQPIAQGQILVLRDAGTRRPPRVAPDTTIDADGRRYTVLYQSAMPRISVRWPRSPAAGDFRLSVRSENGGIRSFPTSGPLHSFDPGALPEGEHVLTFDAGNERSRSTTLAIRFDNAAPTANVVSPVDRSFQGGSRVLVAGTALAGWKVSVSGQAIELDDQFRFSTDVSSPSWQRALVIRFQHPQRGTHYYLRRSTGALGQ